LDRSLKYTTVNKQKGGILLPRTSGSRKKKEIAKKIKKWLAEEGFQASKVQDTNTDFHFQIQNPNMSIIIDKRKIDCVTLVTYMGFPEIDQRMLSYLSKEGKKFFWNLEYALNQLNVMYNIHPSIEEVERIDITKIIYFDGLTKHTFFSSLFDIQRGMHCVNIQYQWLSEQGFQ